MTSTGRADVRAHGRLRAPLVVLAAEEEDAAGLITLASALLNDSLRQGKLRRVRRSAAVPQPQRRGDPKGSGDPLASAARAPRPAAAWWPKRTGLRPGC